MKGAGIGLPKGTLRVAAIACLSFAALSRFPILAATAAGVGLILYVWSLVGGDDGVDRHSFRWAGVSVILIVLVSRTGAVGTMIDPVGALRPLWMGSIVVAAVLAIFWGHKNVPRRLSVALALIAVATTTTFMTVQDWRSDSGIDVYWMHREAGSALVNGENPYTDAVRVPNGSPFAPDGAFIEGYPYPPVVLGTYGASGAAADPRVVSTLAWFGLLTWMAWRSTRPDTGANTAYAMFLLLSGLAVWPVVWFASWTEPLSIGLLLLSAVLWRKRPVQSAVALGLAIASKQYFVFLAPLLFLHKDDSKQMRLLVAFGVASFTILAGLLPDPSAFISATVANLSEIGFRPDTQSLSGLLASLGVELYLSSAVWIVIGLLLSTIVARGSSSVSDFFGRVPLALGLVFFFGQAFTNYWFLVIALMAVATVMASHPDARVGQQSEVAPGRVAPADT